MGTRTELALASRTLQGVGGGGGRFVHLSCCSFVALRCSAVWNAISCLIKEIDKEQNLLACSSWLWNVLRMCVWCGGVISGNQLGAGVLGNCPAQDGWGGM